MAKLTGAVAHMATRLAMNAEVQALAECLSPMDLLPLKGVLLAALGWDDPKRRTTDLDVLVRSASFAEAISRLIAAGYRPRVVYEETGRSLTSPSGLVVDVHNCLFGAHRFRLDSEGVFERATVDEISFGAPVLRMDDRDLYAHLLGKWVMDGALDSVRAAELLRLSSNANLSTEDLVTHLERVGMRRAARYFWRRHSSDAFAAEASRTLANRDRIGAAVVGVATPLMKLPRPIRYMAKHALNHDLVSGVRSATTAVIAQRKTKR